ncbi:MAG: PilT/PilU family type 4a pilus ATPase, partial [bacterium]
MAKKINQLLENMVSARASDLHLKIGRPPVHRIDGKLHPTDLDRIQQSDMDNFVYDVLSEAEQERFHKQCGIDIAYSLPGVSRFRVNVFYQRGTVAMVIRTIPFQVATLKDLGMPDMVTNLAQQKSGLVLITGPAGCGKSTTLAAIIEHINTNFEKQIITIEDPIEFLFKDKICSIVQREVGADTPSFVEGLRMVFRQDPDVIVIGEMRDLETIQTAMGAAETGHLVLSTLHTMDASQTADRIIDSFPQTAQRQVRLQFSQTLRGIISQRLVKRADEEGRYAAVEIMINSPTIAERLLEGRTGELYEAMRSSVEDFGMQTLEQSLVALRVHEIIDLKEAQHAASRLPDLDNAMRALFPDY